MSIIGQLQAFLQTFDMMEMQPIMLDMPGKKAGTYAIAAAGDGGILEDIVGNREYIKNYVFFAKENAKNETDKQDAYDFLDAFTDWIELQNDAGIYPDLGERYEVNDMSVSNVMLFDIEENSTGIYQVQIQLTITKQRREYNG